MDMAVIVGVVVLNVVIGYIQEGKAEGALDALKRTLVAKCTVIRNGEATIIPVENSSPAKSSASAGATVCPPTCG